MTFNALWLTDPKEEHAFAKIEQVAETTLPDFPITLRVLYSSLNYKDALAISAKAPVIRQFPLIPGIDMIGEVISSESSEWPIGKLAAVTGWGIGEHYHGGLAEIFQAKVEWLTSLPDTISPANAALIGTAGLTAMLAVIALEQQGITPEKGPIAVSGASGGVGSFSTWILAQLGYHVIAISGDTQAQEYLVDRLGANSIIPRGEFSEPGKKLQPERWAGAIDCVGSHTLANLLAATQRNGCVVACGMAQGLELNSSVAPFILRGIRLVGIDSVYCEVNRRNETWQRFATLLAHSPLPIPYETIALNQVIAYADRLLKGTICGRIIVQTTVN